MQNFNIKFYQKSYSYSNKNKLRKSIITFNNKQTKLPKNVYITPNKKSVMLMQVEMIS